jgi:hypothetical protein
MADTMSMDISRLERLVADLISKDKISARIDSQRKTLHRRQHDVRSVAIGKVLRLAEKNCVEVKRGILRLSLMQHNFCVPQRDTAQAGRGAAGLAAGPSDPQSVGAMYVGTGLANEAMVEDGGYAMELDGVADGDAIGISGSSGEMRPEQECEEIDSDQEEVY